MRNLTWIVLMLMATGCANDDLSWISIRNQTEVPIFAQPYSSEFAKSDWIPPGGMNEFYSINCDCLDAFEYFSFYYDSLIVYLQDHEEEPIKFYPDGSTVNYDPKLNPFINPNVWRTRELDNHIPEKHISEHYFSITAEHIISLAGTGAGNLDSTP